MTNTNTTPQVQVGDFFVESWGYDQTNIDFYQVIEISKSGKTVYIAHVDSQRVDSNGYTDQVVPVRDAFNDRGSRGADVKAKRLKASTWDGENRPYLNMSSYSNAYLWSGRPASQTGAMYGH